MMVIYCNKLLIHTYNNLSSSSRKVNTLLHSTTVNNQTLVFIVRGAERRELSSASIKTHP